MKISECLMGKIVNMKRKKVIILIVALILLVIIVKYWLEPIQVNREDVSRISISCDYFPGRVEAEINNEKEIDVAMKKINTFKAIDGDDDVLVERLGGDTPDATILFWNEKGKIINEINFYGDMISYDKNLYKIVGYEKLQYNKLLDLCEKYGEVEMY